MTAPLARSLLERRLDRLRPLESATRSSAALGRSGGKPAQDQRVASLAVGVDGRVLSTSDGPIVLVETTSELPLAAAALADLPYGVDAGRPLVCIDVETTGLGTAAGTLPFLVGVGSWQAGAMTIRQLLLPDQSHEPALLTALASFIPRDAWLVTYNGRSFDWPLLVSRFRLHRRDPPAWAGHLDLLPIARQLWKHRLGNARLATVESVAGVYRLDDLPGALVPERYFRYLREGDPGSLRAVVRHNRQDIVSLALLLAVLAERLALPERWPEMHPGDLGGLARAYARDGRVEDALACLQAGLSASGTVVAAADGGVIRRRLLIDRARLLARAGRHEEAALAWLELTTSSGPGAVRAWLWLARHREHRLHDYPAALQACMQAAAIAERARAWSRPLVGVERDLRRRMPRLRRRVLSAQVRRGLPRVPAA